jgi:hypothetical protein
MSNVFIRVRIPKEIYKRFKLHCIEMNLSIPRQTTEFFRKFVEVQDENKRLKGD